MSSRDNDGFMFLWILVFLLSPLIIGIPMRLCVNAIQRYAQYRLAMRQLYATHAANATATVNNVPETIVEVQEHEAIAF